MMLQSWFAARCVSPGSDQVLPPKLQSEFAIAETL